MSYFIDIYGLTRCREKALIDRFVERFTKREEVEDRHGEELMMLKLNAVDSPETPGWELYDWEPALTLEHSIQRGLDIPRRCFAIYLPSQVAVPGSEIPISNVIIKFTDDDKLILGFSIHDESFSNEIGSRLIDILLAEYECVKGFSMSAYPPPDDEEEFDNMVDDAIENNMPGARG
jgi:hypothetical protein